LVKTATRISPKNIDDGKVWQEVLLGSQQNVPHLHKEYMQSESQGIICGAYSCGRMENIEGKPKV